MNQKFVELGIDDGLKSYLEGLGYRIKKVFPSESYNCTFLVEHDRYSGLRVVKATSIDHWTKLYNQSEWIREKKNTGMVPKVELVSQSSQFCHYEMEYLDDAENLFSFIHKSSLHQIEKTFDRVFTFLKDHVHTSSPLEIRDDGARDYIHRKILHKLDESEAHLPLLAKFTRQQTVSINGTDYCGPRRLVEALLNDAAALRKVATFRPSFLHGDLTVENILISPSGPYLLDPNDENILSSRALDYAKLYQSLESGYEFMRLTKVLRFDEQRLDFDLEISDVYTKVFDLVQLRVQEALRPDEMDLLDFYQATHYFRMLPYKAIFQPKIFPVYLATATVLLDRFCRSSGARV